MLKAYFQCKKYDKELSCLRSTPKYRSRSFVQGFLKIHYVLLQGSTGLSVTDTSGSGGTLSATSQAFHLRATGSGRGGGNFATSGVYRASDEAGIVVGTGTTSVAPTDFQLATKIEDGTSSGQLEYLPCSGTNLTISAPTGSFDMERLFRNSSGGSITINEVGIYVIANAGVSSGIDQICIIRDIVSPGFAVNNGEFMRVIYTLSVTA